MLKTLQDKALGVSHSSENRYIMSADYPFPGYHQQQNNLPQAKKEFPRLASVPSQVLQTNIRRLHDAWDFFQKRGYGFPHFARLVATGGTGAAGAPSDRMQLNFS